MSTKCYFDSGMMKCDMGVCLTVSIIKAHHVQGDHNKWINFALRYTYMKCILLHISSGKVKVLCTKYVEDNKPVILYMYYFHTVL